MSKLLPGKIDKKYSIVNRYIVITSNKGGFNDPFEDEFCIVNTESAAHNMGQLLVNIFSSITAYNVVEKTFLTNGIELWPLETPTFTKQKEYPEIAIFKQDNNDRYSPETYKDWREYTESSLETLQKEVVRLNKKLSRNDGYNYQLRVRVDNDWKGFHYPERK